MAEGKEGQDFDEEEQHVGKWSTDVIGDSGLADAAETV